MVLIVRRISILVFALGAALAAPAIWIVWFVVDNYSVGFGVDLNWLGAISLAALLGCVMMIWSGLKLRSQMGSAKTVALLAIPLLILIAITNGLAPHLFAVTFIVGEPRN